MKREIVIAIIIYIITWGIVFIVPLLFALGTDISFKAVLKNLIEALAYTSFLISIHVLFIVLCVLFLLIRYFKRLYYKKGIRIMGKRVLYNVVIPIFVIVCLYKIIVYTNSSEDFIYQWDHSIENTNEHSKNLYKNDGKHRGMSVFGWKPDNTKAITSLVKNNIEWVAVIPFISQKDNNTTKISMPDSIGQWSKRDSTFINTIQQLQNKGIHVQLKPHLWVIDGWRSEIDFSSDSDWKIWFERYRKNMLHYAHMAEKSGVSLFCIGTELKSSLERQPRQWKALVKEIKAIYSGKLTYAANWDGEYEIIDFWSDLDYIGIQAYFPLTQKVNPDLASIKKGWNTHIKTLENLSRNHQRPILFTEVGYKSETSATIKPWEWGSYFSILYQKKSDRTQQLAYQALFESLWNKEWFAGTYIWEWDTRTTKESAPQSLNFSPRFKPAQNTIAKWYSK